MHKPFRSLTLIGVTILSFLTGATPVTAADLTVADVKAWLKGYETAWETLDPEQAAALFTENATYRDNPYENAYQGRAGIRQYWATVTSDQKDVDFTSEVLTVTGTTGIAHWRSQFKSKESGDTITLDGIFVLEFADSRLCRSLKEWWHLKVDPAAEK